ncbi:MAG: DUF2752 domain-containing protein [Oscillospiraceae bacterium]|nr:DUF2752 domain-containing protein [Oscillospiraceae bacterium]
MKQRILKVCGVYALLALGVLGYCLFFRLLGGGLECPFHVLTGLYCPGCGNSRALHAMAQLHFAEALRLNYLMPLEAAFVLYAAVRTTAHYLRTGVYRLTIGPEWVGIVFLAVLLVWWVVRNLLGV